MKTSAINTRLPILAALAALCCLAGCIHYTAETTVRADGGGERYLEIAAPVTDQDKDAEFEFHMAEFREIFGLSDERGWDYKKETRGDGEVHLFTSRKGVRSAETWQSLSGDILIRGSMGSGPLSDIVFRNMVHVESGHGEDAEHITFREVFYWDGLIMALFENQLDHIGPMLERRYPDVDPAIRGEVVGLLKGGCVAALEHGILEMSDRERALELMGLYQLIEEQVVRTVRSQYPEAEEKFLSDLVWEVMVDRDEADDRFVKEKLPGVDLASNVIITVHLTMPGKILSSNADRREGNALIWEIGPVDAYRKPIEIYATASVED